jgi:hypothetical protein
MKGVLLWLVCWVCCVGTRDCCLALVAVVGSVQNMSFLIVHYISVHLSPSVALGHLSHNVCL